MTVRSGAMNPIERAELEIAEMERLAATPPASAHADPAAPPVATPPVVPAEAEPPVAPVVVPAAAPPEPIHGQPPAASTEDPVALQRERTFQGILKSRDAQIQQLMEQNNMLLQRLEQFMAAPAAPAKDPRAEAQAVIAALAEEHGSDIVGLVQRVAELQYGGELQALKSEITRLQTLTQRVDTLGQRQEQTEQEQFLTRLAGRVPDYQAMMAAPDFWPWAAATFERFTGKTFQQLFQEANNGWNLEGMAGVFAAYKEAHPPAAPQTDPRLSLVVPGSSPSNPSTIAPANQPKMWKREEVDAFYRNATKPGYYTDAEYERISREIDEANSQGRIV